MMNIYLPFLYIVTIVATLLLLYLDPVRIAKHLYRKLTPGAANKNQSIPQASGFKYKTPCNVIPSRHNVGDHFGHRVFGCRLQEFDQLISTVEAKLTLTNLPPEKTSKTWFYKLPAAIFPIFYWKKIIMCLILSGAHNCNKLGSCPG